jgi:hypothetical protein
MHACPHQHQGNSPHHDWQAAVKDSPENKHICKASFESNNTCGLVAIIIKATMTSAVTMDMVWSEDELRHAFHYLLKNPLKGNESLMVYRNARKKYSEAFR